MAELVDTSMKIVELLKFVKSLSFVILLRAKVLYLFLDYNTLYIGEFF